MPEMPGDQDDRDLLHRPARYGSHRVRPLRKGRRRA